MDLTLILRMAAEGFGDRTAVGPRGLGATYAQLQEQVRRLGGELRGKAGERVAFLGLTSAALPRTLFACAHAGKAFVPLNYRWTDPELRDVMRRAGLQLTVADADMFARIAGLDDLEVIEAGAEAHQEGAKPSDETEPSIDPDGTAVLMFTSGTTGGPKTAVLRHRHLAGYILGSVDFMSAGEDECALISVPPYHIAGIAATLSSVYSGRRMVHLGAFDPQRWIDLVRAEEVTHAMVVPTMLSRIVETLAQDGDGLPSLRHLSYGGGRMPVEVVEHALEILPGVDFVNAYGLTETSSTVALLTPEDHRTARASTDPGVRARLGSVGRALPTVEIQVRDQIGRAIGPNETGEIYVRGPQVSGEYLDRAALDADGWFPTRDGGSIDAAGYLYVDGRLDDIIVRGGENISPSEIELVLASHPAVQEAAVFGLLDDEWGERIAAAVVLHPGYPEVDAEELRALVRAQLRSNRVPDVIAVRDGLPYSETGKLLRRVLRAELAAPVRS